MAAKSRTATFLFAFGETYGLGHLRRCEALAVELSHRGWSVEGIPHGEGSQNTSLGHITLSPAFPVRHAPASADLAVVDSYSMPYSERSALGADGTKLLSFHDSPVADPSDLIVDINCGANAAAYAGEGCVGRVLCGPEYFPVRPALDRLTRESRDKNRLLSATTLLVTFGGSDPHHLAEKTLQELATIGTQLDIRVVIGDLGSQTPELQAAANALPKVELVPPGTEVEKLFAWADMAICAAGLTKYELALLGVPALIVAAYDNQAAVAETFAVRGSALYLGRAEELVTGALARAVNDLALDSQTRAELSAAGRKLVDGRGAARIADEIEKLMEGTS